MFLPVTESGRVPVDAAGAAVLVTNAPSSLQVRVGEFTAVLMEEAAASALGTLRDATFFAGQPLILKAIHLVRNRRETRFDPRTGRELDYAPPGIVGRDPADERRMVFPRLDPAVIGLVELAGQERILLGANRRRRGYYSLIAGYVDPGETLEEAFAREVLEETGRRVRNISYWGSQPWPPSGSLMVGFRALTEDVEPVCDTDGELAESRWLSREELPGFPIARKGTIAHTMIMEWYHGA
ncbi:NAD(+) diphosphatase [Corynebacterium sp.]|uniref:NAD(+) diphosphatase n=1 Tax=Corynebacterium sp. TaxID=1720 RepID=UPI0026DAC81E|nr:NUDIX domain-containing protein [Corynebacterium sp.]MDO5032081.1 NUDIX domain-containing protein [Corynebacterium sp.]